MVTDGADLEIAPCPGGVEFRVKVVPGASHTRIAGLLGGVLKATVAAPPEGGRANAALLELLADRLAVKKGQLAIVGGATQRLKRIRVSGLTADQARQRLARHSVP